MAFKHHLNTVLILFFYRKEDFIYLYKHSLP